MRDWRAVALGGSAPIVPSRHAHSGRCVLPCSLCVASGSEACQKSAL